MKAVIFNVADKEYAVDIMQVREVVRMKKVVPVPDAAESVEGVINLRSQVVPLVNLRKKLKSAAGAQDKPGRIIIGRLKNNFVGMMVDGVSDVLAIEEGDITPPNEILKKARYLTGVGRLGERIFLVIDFEKLFTLKEKTNLARAHKKAEVKQKKPRCRKRTVKR